LTAVTNERALVDIAQHSQ